MRNWNLHLSTPGGETIGWVCHGGRSARPESFVTCVHLRQQGFWPIPPPSITLLSGFWRSRSLRDPHHRLIYDLRAMTGCT